jgi:hypothetical protein
MEFSAPPRFNACCSRPSTDAHHPDPFPPCVTPVPPRQDLLPADQLPYILCDRHQLNWRPEHSFKVEIGTGLLSSRYVLGIDRESIAPHTWNALLHDLQLPEHHPGLMATLAANFQQASTVYLGFEQRQNGGNLRLYFEYWDEVVRRLRKTPAADIQAWQGSEPPLWPMGVGYKWPAVDIHRLCITRYGVRPLLEPLQILERARQLLVGQHLTGGDAVAGTVLALMKYVLASRTTISPVFLEVDEPGSPRRSFDLCVHRYRLRLLDVANLLQQMLRSCLGPTVSLQDALGGHSPQSWLSHLSAGISRQGLPYACIYYEPA